jgi:pyruvate/2-oxoglutarate dehydrogenase complex dihydrolipoamide dehydrogenase (E3) component
MRVLVVGGGPAGVTAALQATELGADVTLLEAEEVGGTNLNRGPAPVRTLARAARLARDWSSWERFGLKAPGRCPTSRPSWPTAPGSPASPTTRRTLPGICAAAGST